MINAIDFSSITLQNELTPTQGASMNIIVLPPVDGENGTVYKAHIEDAEGTSGSGRSPEEALGNLVRNHVEIFGLVVVEMPT